MTNKESISDHWSYWSLASDQGRTAWRFCPPAAWAHTDWTGGGSEAELAFLEQHSQAFVFDKNKNPNSADRIYRLSRQVISSPTTDTRAPKSVSQAAERGITFYQSLQTGDGCWLGDYAGPMFLLPGLIIASYVTHSPFPAPHRTLMSRYMLNHQNPDGGWGLHIEGASTMFGTVLQYVSLRLLGMEASAPACVRARDWIHRHGGATGIPSWGKFYLSVLAVYHWDGCHSLCPELWLLPESLPVHPSRYWCHTRMVYLPMAYCYGHRVTGADTFLTSALREELYTEPYSSIDWSAARSRCAAPDLYYPQSSLLKGFNSILDSYERIHLRSLRRSALDFTLEYINAEDAQTNYIDIGPVNQVINSICIWHQYGRDSDAFRRHLERWEDYLWLAEDGMKMQGYNGSQLWDTAFALQAVIEGGFEKNFPELTARAYQFIAQSQITTEVPDRQKFYRHIQIGGWPFSTLDHGWPITDCTAEGLKAILAMMDRYSSLYISDERIYQAVNVILSYQNKNGGWATYENTRAPAWLELLNPAEIFGGIMTDYSYVECSAACVQALIRFQNHFPAHRAAEIRAAISNGLEFILSAQLADGSWYGSWAVCFTYGTWFGVEALSQFIALSQTDSDLVQRATAAIARACTFIRSRQNADGGWGESFQSSMEKRYIPSPASQLVNTSWALLSLMAAGDPSDMQRIDRGIQLLIDRQQPDGDWQQENISGVFNHNCMISYTSYRNVFPIWALGRYQHLKKN